jgi:glycerol-3-phosphate acyltransferase PlsY
MGRFGALSSFMTIQYSLLFGVISMIVYVTGFTIAYIVYERHRKNIERIEADKKKTTPYDFK